MISVVIETFNLVRDGATPASAGALLAVQVARLVPQLVEAGADTELLITLDPALASIAGTALAYPARWIALPAGATYYEHKNRGFAASRGDIVAFLDGDCTPAPAWLAALVAPIADVGAQVVAGFTTYPGALAAVGNALDFPYFPGREPGTVANLFANNVAFARATFAAHPYPAALPMFHGQCQVLALELGAAGIAIHHAPAARVEHAPPADARAWLTVRLLRGADARSLLPHIVAAYTPFASPIVERLGPIPALVLFGARLVLGTARAARRGPRLRNLARVAGCTVADSIGAVAASAVYRRLG